MIYIYMCVCVCVCGVECLQMVREPWVQSQVASYHKNGT